MSRKEWLLIGISLLCGTGTFVFIEPIPQWLEYHQFADNRTMLGIPNALNVLSNLPFLIFGLWGAGILVTAMARHGYEARLFCISSFLSGSRWLRSAPATITFGHPTRRSYGTDCQ